VCVCVCVCVCGLNWKWHWCSCKLSLPLLITCFPAFFVIAEQSRLKRTAVRNRQQLQQNSVKVSCIHYNLVLGFNVPPTTSGTSGLQGVHDKNRRGIAVMLTCMPSVPCSASAYSSAVFRGHNNGELNMITRIQYSNIFYSAVRTRRA